MPKRPRNNDGDKKKNSWSSLPWESVDVVNQDDDGSNNTDYGGGKNNGKDDEAVNAVFFGLEVIDGSKYRVVTPCDQDGNNTTGCSQVIAVRQQQDDEDNEGTQVVRQVGPGDKTVNKVSASLKKKSVSTEKQKKTSIAEKKVASEKKSTSDKQQPHPSVPLKENQGSTNPKDSTIVDAGEQEKKPLNRNEKRKLKRQEKKRLTKERQQQEPRPCDNDKHATTIASDDADTDQAPTLNRKERQKLKRQEKKRLQRQQQESAAASSGTVVVSDVVHDDDTAAVLSATVQTAWSAACGGVWLHADLCAGLARLRYVSPTPIQAASLPASILGRRNIVGAAPTGSGKTLAYGLPILQHLWSDDTYDPQATFLTALIACPTRELALQVSRELRSVAGERGPKIGTVVGGLAEQKQRRVLDKVRPPILVATPGRLWELMSKQEHSHLQNLSHLRFLVIDEADRMISQGSFPQLRQIFDHIERYAPSPPDEDSDGEDDGADETDDDDEDDDRLRALQGVRGESKVMMFDPSMLAKAQEQSLEEAPVTVEEESEGSIVVDMEEDDDDDESVEEENTYIPRQTFIYSATLTLPSALLSQKQQHKPKKRKKNHKNIPTSVEGALADILEQAGAVGPTKVVDLTSDDNSSNAITAVTTNGGNSNSGNNTGLSKRLPPGLSLYQIQCTQRHKDSHCYAYLSTTEQGSSGPCLIFCNSIQAVRRVGSTLQHLGLPVKTLHAQMAQKQRFSALESLKKIGSRDIVVATDVAARGLDIPSVATVIHYDVARAVDTFIHRAGRTARGVGEKAVGCSISLVAPGEEDRKHLRVCEAVRGKGTGAAKQFDIAVIDGHLLSAAQERTALATKIVAYEDGEARVNQNNKWFCDAARDCDIDLDDDLLEVGLMDNGDNRDRAQAKEAIQAKTRLRQLLAKPMRKQNFGKFLAGAGMAAAVKAEAKVAPHIIKNNSTGGKGKKKKVVGKRKIPDGTGVSSDEVVHVKKKRG